MQTDPATPDRCGKCLHPDHDRECPSCDCRNMRPTPATPDEAVARYPYHENPVLVDALAFAHQRALVGLVHTAPDWRGCGFFPCNAYDAITEAALSRRQGDTVAALRGDLYLRLLDHYGSPRHAMDVATLVAAALGPGWTLSRQQGDTVAARVGRLVSLGYWVSVGRAYDVPVRACVFSEEEDADATADGPTIEAALRDLVAYVERPCVCGHAWASHQPEYDYPVWASHCTHPADDGCGRWEDPEPRREPIPVAPGQVDMGIVADGAGDGR